MLKLFALMFTVRFAATVMLEAVVGIVNATGAAIVVLELNTIKPLFTIEPPFAKKGASNGSVQSLSTTVIVPLFCEKLGPAMVATPAGAPPIPPVAPLSTLIAAPAPKFQAVDTSSTELCAIDI